MNKSDVSNSVRGLTKYRLILVGHEFVKKHWSTIATTLQEAFKGADFSSEFPRDRPMKHTWSEINNPSRPNLRHLLAMDTNCRPVGGIFCIPVIRHDERSDCDIGWFFVSKSVSRRERAFLAEALVVKCHETVLRAGFTKIITEMGTKDGAAFLKKRFGYKHTPIKNQGNRYACDLIVE